MQQGFEKRKIVLLICLIGLFGAYAFHYYSITSFGIWIKKMEVIGLLVLFIILNIVVERKKLYAFLFKYRWMVYCLLFVFFVINKFNLSSLGVYNQLIQPGHGSEYINPVFGIPRAIRSDEWLVTLPRWISASYSNFGATNNLVRGVTTNNISSSGLMLDYSSLWRPANYGFYLFGIEYGVSFSWSFNLIFGFAIWFELFLILTNSKKSLSFLGAILIWYSPFNLWWSMSGLLLSGAGIIVLFYYFVVTDSHLKRLFFGTLLAIMGADFVCSLYPAWQVPMGYIILAIMIWTLIKNNQWKYFKKIDWLVFAFDVIFMISIIARYLYVDMDYITAIQETVYPGARIDYGGMSVTKLLGYFASEISVFGGIGNTCEAGVIFGAFPLGIILGCVAQIKEKGKNSLLWCLFVPTLTLCVYCTVGLPPIIAKILLLTNSTRFRAVDFLGVLSGIILIVSIGIIQNRTKLELWQSFLCVAISNFIGCYYSLKIIEDPKFNIPIIVFAIITTIGMVFIVTDIRNSNIGKFSCLSSAVCLVIAGLYINPVMVGLDVITSKPAAKEIQSIVADDPNGKWIAIDSFYNQGFVLACGAPTINSTNYIPNYDLWSKLDPNREFEEVWNRYAHMIVKLIDDNASNFYLNFEDSMTIELSVKDIDKFGARYIFSQHEINGKWADYLSLIYNEYDVWIYEVK